MNTVSEFTTIIALPVAAVPAAIQVFQNPVLDRFFRPQARVDKWTRRVDEIVRIVLAKREYVPIELLRAFLQLIQKYKIKRRQYQNLIINGHRTWIGEGKRVGDKFALYSRKSHRQGWHISQQAMYTEGTCYIEHRDVPKRATGHCSKCFPEHFDDLDALSNPEDEENFERAIDGWLVVLKDLEAEMATMTIHNPSVLSLQLAAAPPNPESDSQQSIEMMVIPSTTGSSTNRQQLAESSVHPNASTSDVLSSVNSTNSRQSSDSNLHPMANTSNVVPPSTNSRDSPQSSESSTHPVASTSNAFPEKRRSVGPPSYSESIGSDVQSPTDLPGDRPEEVVPTDDAVNWLWNTVQNVAADDSQEPESEEEAEISASIRNTILEFLESD